MPQANGSVIQTEDLDTILMGFEIFFEKILGKETVAQFS